METNYNIKKCKLCEFLVCRCNQFQFINLSRKGMFLYMETWYYEVVSIDGDYANLKRTDIELDDLKLVARALLPAEIMVGSKLKYELMQYEII